FRDGADQLHLCQPRQRSRRGAGSGPPSRSRGPVPAERAVADPRAGRAGAAAGALQAPARQRAGQGASMRETLTPDLCVIGAGSAGLAVAAGAVQMGASVVLVERGRMGGDCLNYGCVPSKSLLAAAKIADSWHRGAEIGVIYQPPRIDFATVADSVDRVVARLAPNDSAERFERLGVRVIAAE